MQYISLSETELEIMHLLWEKGGALSRPEILQGLQGKPGNPNSIHQILNNMMKKGVIRVEGMARCGKVYGRTYTACISQQEFFAQYVRKVTPDLSPQKRMLIVVQALMEQDDLGEEAFRKLEELVALYKQRLG